MFNLLANRIPLHVCLCDIILCMLMQSRIHNTRSLCVRLVERASEDVVCPPFRPPLGGEEGSDVARSLARVGACADELRLMGL